MPAALPVSQFRWPLRRRARARWALVLGLALLLGAGYWLRGWPGRLPDTVATYSTTGNRQKISLPDGSVAWLNARSRLRYAGAGPGATAGPRTVQLIGEAYFEVAHNPARPFQVFTATTQVRVTGTAFNVRAYAAEDSVEVTVTQGRVWVRRLAAPDSVLLTARTRAAVYAADAPGRRLPPLRQTAAAGTNFRAWQTDTLRFAEATGAQVAHTLRALYGTAVRLDPGVGQCRFSGTFVRPRPGQVLQLLAIATASRLSSDGQGGYLLQGPGCSAADSTGSSAVPTPSVTAQARQVP